MLIEKTKELIVVVLTNGSKFIGVLDVNNQTDKNKININNAYILQESGSKPNKRYSISPITDATNINTISIQRSDAILSGVVVDTHLIQLYENTIKLTS